jgi:hypothetical protein
MDPITTSHLVQDRTDALQRTADQIRRERRLRSIPSSSMAEAVAVPVPQARPADPPREASKANDCAPAERAERAA